MLHDLPRTSGGVRPEFAARIDGGVDAGMDAVADNGAELAAAGVDEFTVDHGPVVLAVVPEIRGGGAGAEVDFFAQHGVTDVGKVADVGVGKDQAVLDLDRLADVAAFTDGGAAAQVAVRADLGVGSDDDVSFDEDARQDARTGAEMDDALDHGGGVDGAVAKR